MQGYGTKSWGFPKGKINKDEPFLDCAIREVRCHEGTVIFGGDLVCLLLSTPVCLLGCGVWKAWGR